jgi:hypothetical protein
MRRLQLVVLALTVALASLTGELMWGDQIVWGD